MQVNILWKVLKHNIHCFNRNERKEINRTQIWRKAINNVVHTDSPKKTKQVAYEWKEQAGGKDTNLKAPDQNFLVASGITITKFNIQKLCKAKKLTFIIFYLDISSHYKDIALMKRFTGTHEKQI